MGRTVFAFCVVFGLTLGAGQLLMPVDTPAAAPPRPGVIAPGDAGPHVGETATVEGMVEQVHTARSGKATFLDFGAPYPMNVFTGVIFESDMGRVGSVKTLEGKTVDLTGRIQLYRGKPEIIIRQRSQIADRQ